jgi:hypothetical protein
VTLGDMRAFGIGIANQQEVVMKLCISLAALLTLPLLVGAAAAQAKLERLYVIECGERTAPDVAPWTPGVNVGKPVDFVDNCYLIKHGTDWMVLGHRPDRRDLFCAIIRSECMEADQVTCGRARQGRCQTVRCKICRGFAYPS